MRTNLTAALACLIAAAAASAGEREDALAIIDQAVQAQGGAGAVAKTHVAVRTGQGALYEAGKEEPFTDQMTWDLPDRWRDAVEIDKKVQFSIAVNGDKAWQSQAGSVTDVGAERLKELRDEIYVLGLQNLTSLRKDGLDLSPLPQVAVGGQSAVGVKVAAKDRPEVRLYFDARTHLLVKMERPTEEAGLRLTKEYLFGDYKEFDGVKMPTRLAETLQGKKISELTSASYKFPAKADDAAFARP